MSQDQSTPRRIPILIGILALYVILATIYSVTIPLGEAPDEAPHFTVIRYIVEHGRLPSSEEEHEAFQPPLYYLLGVALTFWADYDGYVIKANADFSLAPGAPKNLLLHDRSEAFPYRGPALAWHILRFFSVLCGAVTIYATYQLGRIAFPRRPAIAWSMAALNAFIPEFLFMSAVVNNDNLAGAFSALLLWQIARLVRKGTNPGHVAALGVLWGGGILSKVSVAVTGLPLAGALAYVAWRREGRLGPAARRALAWWALAMATALAVCGWWLVRNQILYGDAIGWEFVLRTNALREGPLTPAVLLWLVKGLFRSFWLAWIGIEFSAPLYWALAGLCILAVLGLVRLVLIGQKTLGREEKVILVLMFSQIVGVGASLLKWTATVLGTDQARLLYPALPAILLFLVLGLATWLPARREHWLAGGLGTAFLLLAIISPWVYIRPVYAPPERISRAEMEAMATPASIRFGDAIELVGYRLPETVRAGDMAEILLCWVALRPVEQDLWLTLSLSSDLTAAPFTKDGSPSAGRDTTDWWEPGEIIAARHFLPVPESAPAGVYRLEMGIHPFGSWEWLPAGSAQSTHIELGQIRVHH